MYLPACEFGGQLCEEVGGGPAAGVGQRAGVVVGQGGGGGRRSVDRGDAVSQLASVEGATDGGASRETAPVPRGGGGGGPGARDTESGGRGRRHAVTQGAGERRRRREEIDKGEGG